PTPAPRRMVKLLPPGFSALPGDRHEQDITPASPRSVAGPGPGHRLAAAGPDDQDLPPEPLPLLDPAQYQGADGCAQYRPEPGQAWLRGGDLHGGLRWRAAGCAGRQGGAQERSWPDGAERGGQFPLRPVAEQQGSPARRHLLRRTVQLAEGSGAAKAADGALPTARLRQLSRFGAVRSAVLTRVVANLAYNPPFEPRRFDLEAAPTMCGRAAPPQAESS